MEYKKLILGAVLAAVMSCSAMGAETEAEYSEDDLYILSHIINAEAGDDNCSHEHRIAVGSVVLNRVASDEFPDTIYDVVWQPGQYSPTWNGSYYREPSEDSIEVAKMLLENGSQIPEDCVFQAEFPQGSGEWNHYKTIYGITYICYR